MTPKIIKGQPDSNDHKIPAADEVIIVSVIPIRFPVVSPRTPPNAVRGKQIICTGVIIDLVVNSCFQIWIS